MSDEQQADPWVARYVGAMEQMQSGDYDAACTLLEEIIDEWNRPGDAVPPDLAAHAHCTFACCLRDKGDIQDAIFWFDITARQFAYKGGDAPRAAAMADLLRAGLLEKQGDARTAHAVLEQLTMRIMMESHPDIRTIFNEAMSEKHRMEGAHGIASGDGLTATIPLTTPPGLEELAVKLEKTANAFDKQPRSWTVEKDRLVVREKGRETILPFADITGLALKFDPTRVARNRHKAKVSRRGGKPLEIDNMSYRGIGDFEDKSVAYRSVMLVLAERLANQGASFPVTTGSSWLGWIGSIALTGFIALIVLITFAVGGPILMLIKLGLILFYTPTLFRWIKRNKPRSYPLATLPVEVLPTV